MVDNYVNIGRIYHILSADTFIMSIVAHLSMDLSI